MQPKQRSKTTDLKKWWKSSKECDVVSRRRFIYNQKSEEKHEWDRWNYAIISTDWQKWLLWGYFLVFAGNFIVYGNFLGRGPFPGTTTGKSANSGARNQRPDRRGKRTSNFSVRKILLFLAHLKSPVPATVGKNFASIFIPTLSILSWLGNIRKWIGQMIMNMTMNDLIADGLWNNPELCCLKSEHTS